MNWNVERIHLSQTKSLLNRNSQLKKKMNLVKKLKNLYSENITNLVNELSAENMEQFYSEIVESLLNLKIVSIDDIKNVIRIVSVYARDTKFISLLFTNMKNIYWHRIIYIEIHMIMDDAYDFRRDIRKLFDNAGVKQKIMFIEYIFNFHDDVKLKEYADTEKLKIGIIDLNTFDGKNTERLVSACRDIDLPIVEHKIDNGFKQVIEPNENEFEFYSMRTSSTTKFESPKSAKDIVEFIKNNSPDTYKIDEISKYLRKSENVKMIPVIVNKLKNNMCYLPVLARIIKNCGIICKKSIIKLVDDVMDSKINNRTDLVNAILLLTELIKFRYIGPVDAFNLLDYFYKIKDIEIFCLIVKHIGRFYLIDEQCNSKVREYLDKIIAYGNKCTTMDCVYINDMITRIFPKHHNNSEENFISFMSYYFQNENFKVNSEVNRIIGKNKKYLFVLVCTPWKFKDSDFLCKVAVHFGIDKVLIDFLIFVINLINDTYKLKTLSYIKLLSGLLRCKESKIQEEVIHRFINMNMKKEIKIRVIIFLLSGMTYYIKLRHIPFLKEECAEIKSIEIHNLLFNLCESVGEKYDSIVDEDSLDEEIRFMEQL
ncbi:hypothetical protein P3W45_001551 [Vairimorpha bombi]|jgi:hypothetical protein